MVEVDSLMKMAAILAGCVVVLYEHLASVLVLVMALRACDGNGGGGEMVAENADELACGWWLQSQEGGGGKIRVTSIISSYRKLESVFTNYIYTAYDVAMRSLTT